MFVLGRFELLTEVGEWIGEVHVAGVCDGEGISGIEVFGVVVEPENGTEHGGDLLFGGDAVASDNLLDDRGFILSV